jgi:hypothetical protein
VSLQFASLVHVLLGPVYANALYRPRLRLRLCNAFPWLVFSHLAHAIFCKDLYACLFCDQFTFQLSHYCRVSSQRNKFWNETNLLLLIEPIPRAREEYSIPSLKKKCLERYLYYRLLICQLLIRATKVQGDKSSTEIFCQTPSPCGKIRDRNQAAVHSSSTAGQGIQHTASKAIQTP